MPSVERARHRFSVEEYQRMGESGIFGEDARVELIRGEILEIPPIGSEHAGHVNCLTSLFSRSRVKPPSAARETALAQLQP